MKRLFVLMMYGCAGIFFGLIAACAEWAEEVLVTGDTAAEISLPFAQSAPPPTYQLPFMSGERYQATTYVGHTGWDFNMPGDCGQPVVATTAGVVEQVNVGCPNIAATAPGGNPGCGTGYGNFVRVDHDSESVDSIYAHLEQLFVRQGQWVERGQTIGKLGTSGDSTGCHLHYETRDGNNQWFLPTFAWDGGSGGLIHGSSYTSRNQNKFDSQRTARGIVNVGNQTTANATRVHALGFSLSYSGGAYGDCTMYYEALGCDGSTSCPAYNNTNYAWVVRGAIRATYFSMGGPNSWLGFPTGVEYTWNNGQRQNFRNGYLFWNRANGVTTAYHY